MAPGSNRAGGEGPREHGKKAKRRKTSPPSSSSGAGSEAGTKKRKAGREEVEVEVEVEGGRDAKRARKDKKRRRKEKEAEAAAGAVTAPATTPAPAGGGGDGPEPPPLPDLTDTSKKRKKKKRGKKEKAKGRTEADEGETSTATATATSSPPLFVEDRTPGTTTPAPPTPPTPTPTPAPAAEGTPGRKDRKGKKGKRKGAREVQFFRCELCDKEFNSQTFHTNHLNGKYHAKRVGRQRERGATRTQFTLFVGQLDKQSSKADIAAHFGTVVAGGVRVRLLTDRATKESRGIAFAEFDSGEDVKQALTLHHSKLHGQRINVEWTAGGGGSSDNRKTTLDELRAHQRRTKQAETLAVVEQFCLEHPDDLSMSDVDGRVREFLLTVPVHVTETALAEFVGEAARGDRIANRSAFLMGIIKRTVDGSTRACFTCGSHDHVKAKCPERARHR